MYYVLFRTRITRFLEQEYWKHSRITKLYKKEEQKIIKVEKYMIKLEQLTYWQELLGYSTTNSQLQKKVSRPNKKDSLHYSWNITLWDSPNNFLRYHLPEYQTHRKGLKDLKNDDRVWLDNPINLEFHW